MDRYIVIKNGLVLTLDRKSQTGYYNIIIKNNKFFFIDYENKFNEKEFKSKNPEAEIIDASDKLVMPGLFNSKLISSYSLNKLFFSKCTYENINSFLSLKLIDKHLSNIENAESLRDLLKISYARSLRNGELFVSEGSPSIQKDFFDVYFDDDEWIHQYYNLICYDYTILSDLRGQENFLSLGFKTDEDINNYSLSSIKKSLAVNKLKLFFEASLSQKTFDSIKRIFGKPFSSVLSELDLISSSTIISNPIHLNTNEIEILRKKNASVLISISDYINLSDRKIDLDELVLSGLNLIVGTGNTGNDIFSELKILSNVISKNVMSYENLFRIAILNPSLIFGIANVTGSIERNKSADLIMLSLNDIRNVLTIPEIDSESVCEFIIRYLSVKDISDVILKGEALIRENKETYNVESAQRKAKEISDKIYSAGKYFEYKEKYLMRGRVDKLSINSTDDELEEKEEEEIFVDMTETVEYVGEGEFTIIGTKEEDFEKPREKDEAEEKDSSTNLKEITSLEDDLNLFDDIEESQVLKPGILKREAKLEKKKIEKTGVKDSEKTEREEEPIGWEETESKNDMDENTEVKKSSLKFGFGDEE